VADPGFHLRGGRGLCQRGKGGGCRQSLKVLKVEVKGSLKRVLAIISIKIMLKILRERRKIEKK